MGGWKLFSQFGEPPARQGALDARQQVVVDVEMLHLLQPLQILEGFHAVVVQVQDLEKYIHVGSVVCTEGMQLATIRYNYVVARDAFGYYRVRWARMAQRRQNSTFSLFTQFHSTAKHG